MAEQTYSNPAGRNQSVAADIKGGAKPGKVAVLVPGTDANQKPYHGGQKSTPAGFNQGVKDGKIKV